MRAAAMKLTPPTNPILRTAGHNPAFNVRAIVHATITKGHAPGRRELRRMLRQGNAIEDLGTIYPGMSLYGFTKGHWSLVDLLGAILDQTGPADLTISTWTAHHNDLTRVVEFFRSDVIRSLRFLTDVSFVRRRPAWAELLRERFGDQAIRLSSVHAKFVLIRNEKWALVCRTSMNLNNNPRFEDFMLEDSPSLAAFLQGLMDEIWKGSWGLPPKEEDWQTYSRKVIEGFQRL
jgi:hypothetical protein